MGRRDEVLEASVEETTLLESQQRPCIHSHAVAI